jgi:DNA-binding transcriptional regulator YiaG
METTTIQDIAVRNGDRVLYVHSVPTVSVGDRRLVRLADAVRAERLAVRELLRHTLETQDRLEPEAIKFLRHALGLKSKELAERLMVRAETVSRWEKGEQPNRHIMLVMISLVDAALANNELPTALSSKRDMGRENLSVQFV